MLFLLSSLLSFSSHLTDQLKSLLSLQFLAGRLRWLFKLLKHFCSFSLYDFDYYVRWLWDYRECDCVMTSWIKLVLFCLLYNILLWDDWKKTEKLHYFPLRCLWDACEMTVRWLRYDGEITLWWMLKIIYIDFMLVIVQYLTMRWLDD